MKKKLFIVIATGLFMIAMMVNLSVAQIGNTGILTKEDLVIMTQAQAEINPNCTHGCVSDGDGCYCYTWYPSYKNAPWK